jgi:hypothetical protein
MAAHMAKFTRFVLRYLTGECLLDKNPNSAEVILIRTILTSAIIFTLALVVKNCMHLNFVVSSWPKAFFKHTSENVPWLGAIAAVVYAAFYARFSAQWSYLASLYNEIVQTEIGLQDCSGSDSSVESRRQALLDNWKVGFIDDAETLHLCGKKCFASIIVRWAEDKPGMRDLFIKGSPGEGDRFDRILARAREAHPPGSTALASSRGA